MLTHAKHNQSAVSPRQAHLRWSLVVVTLLAGLFVAPLTAIASPSDAEVWVRESMRVMQNADFAVETLAFGSGYTDRELHFAFSIPLGAVGCQLTSVLLREELPTWRSVALGFSFGMLPGIAKEFYDMAQPTNYFSFRDLAYDAAGALTGALIVWGLHHLARRLNRRHYSTSQSFER